MCYSHTALSYNSVRWFWFIISFEIGVSVLAIGVERADIVELQNIAYPTNYKNVFLAASFDDFPNVEREFILNLCSKALMSEFKQHYDEVQMKWTL